MEASVESARDYLVKVEQVVGSASPFIWTLLRAPWPFETSMKARVFLAVKQWAEEVRLFVDDFG